MAAPHLCPAPEPRAASPCDGSARAPAGMARRWLRWEVLNPHAAHALPSLPRPLRGLTACCLGAEGGRGQRLGAPCGLGLLLVPATAAAVLPRVLRQAVPAELQTDVVLVCLLILAGRQVRELGIEQGWVLECQDRRSQMGKYSVKQ